MDRSLSSEDIRNACERSIAFVFAPNESAAKNLLDAGAVMCASHMAAVFLMADASIAEEAVNAMRQLGRKGRGPLVQAAEFDFSVVYGADTATPGFHLEELPESLLMVMRSLAESMLDVYEYVIVVDASLPAPTKEDVTALFEMDSNESSALRRISRYQLDDLN